MAAPFEPPYETPTHAGVRPAVAATAWPTTAVPLLAQTPSAQPGFSKTLSVCTASWRDPERLFRAYKAPPLQGAFVPLPAGVATRSVVPLPRHG